MEEYEDYVAEMKTRSSMGGGAKKARYSMKENEGCGGCLVSALVSLITAILVNLWLMGKL